MSPVRCLIYMQSPRALLLEHRRRKRFSKPVSVCGRSPSHSLGIGIRKPVLFSFLPPGAVAAPASRAHGFLVRFFFFDKKKLPITRRLRPHAHQWAERSPGPCEHRVHGVAAAAAVVAVAVLGRRRGAVVEADVVKDGRAAAGPLRPEVWQEEPQGVGVGGPPDCGVGQRRLGPVIRKVKKNKNKIQDATNHEKRTRARSGTQRPHARRGDRRLKKGARSLGSARASHPPRRGKKSSQRKKCHPNGRLCCV